MKVTLAVCALAGALYFGANETWAQNVAPPSVDPGRIQQQFQIPKAEAVKPDLDLPDISDTVAPDAAARTPVTLSSIVVEGSSIYSATVLQSMSASLIGHEIRLADVFSLADRISARYRQDGYVLSRAVIPAQKIENGVLRITVVEGYVHTVVLQGPHSDLLAAYGSAIRDSRPLRREVLERYLLLMNALPGVTARAVLEPSAGQTGGTDLTVIVTQKTVDGYVSADNRGSRYLGPVEATAGVAINNLLGLSERTSVDYGTAYPSTNLHDRELGYVDVREDLPLGHDGLLLSLTGARSKSNPGFTLKALDTHTTGTSFSTALSYPMISSRAVTWTVNANFSYLDSNADINDQPEETPSYKDKIRALRVGTDYDFADRYGGHNLLGVEFSQGLMIFGASDKEQLDISRPGSPGNFHKLTLNVSRRQDLDGLLPNLSVFGAIAAQTSFSDPLLSAEQFGLGGATFGRGYEPSEITGDKGIAAKLELQYSQQWKPIESVVQYYSFYDVGAVRNVLTVIDVPQSQSLASAGGGLRFELPGGFAASAEMAKPLTKDVESEVIRGSRNPKRPRAYFSLTKRF